MTNRHYGVKNNAETNLDGGINSTATLLTLLDASILTGAELPSVLTLSNPIDDEDMELVEVQSVDFGLNQVTVIRNTPAEFGAKAHPDGTRVTLRPISRHVKDLQDDALMQISTTAYVEHTRNNDGQITQSDVWETDAKLVKLARVTYTYPSTTSRSPTGAVRLIYKGDGVSVRRTETTTFSYERGIPMMVNRTIT